MTLETLAISLIVTFALIRYNISIAVLAGALTLSILNGGNPFTDVTANMLDWSVWKLIATVVLAFTLGYSMKTYGFLEKITEFMLSNFGYYSLAIIPMLIGLLPMPGGALISAIMLGDIVKKFKIPGEKATFVNYWFRHVWVTIWPLYPNVIIGLGILEVDYVNLAKSTYPIFIFSTLSGFLLLGKGRLERKKANNSNLFYLYPIFLLAFLTLILRIDLLISLLIVNFVLAIHARKLNRIPGILRETIDWKILLLVFSVMLYKRILETYGIAERFLTEIEAYVNPYVAAALLSFLVAFSTGIEMSYSSIALPLLTPFTGVGSIYYDRVLITFLYGFLGVMISPLHLCYVLTADYFKSSMFKTYKYLLIAALLTAVLPLLTIL